MTAIPKDRIRLAALGDLHCRKAAPGRLASIFARAAEEADVLVLCGDLTDYGTEEEARLLVKELSSAGKMPIVGVLGNHDFESHHEREVRDILTDAGMILLDGEACEIHGVGFAGVKGFAGGFGPGMLRPWGEPSIKAFVHEAVEEALKLECALGTLRTTHRIALMHYAPIEATVLGEPREIFPYLGTSRLEDSLHRYPVSMVFHGHAHHGSLEGATSRGVPVYNVALPLLQRELPEHTPFRIVELRTEPQRAALQI
jgi:Icc-related predicted phosphoesterase